MRVDDINLQVKELKSSTSGEISCTHSARTPMPHRAVTATSTIGLRWARIELRSKTMHSTRLLYGRSSAAVWRYGYNK